MSRPATTSGLSVDAAGRPAMEQEPADPRFALPTSGLYWQTTTAKGELRSTSLWDSRLPAARDTPADRWRDRQAAGPFNQRMLIVERVVRPQPDGPAVTVMLASDLARLAPAQREFARETALFLTLLWLILSAAAWVKPSPS